MAFVGPVVPVGSPKTRHTSLRAGLKEPEQGPEQSPLRAGGAFLSMMAALALVPPVPVVALVALPVLREVSHLHVLLWPAAAARRR
eukprot:symbB.v1.2.019800.t1/scaffold1636.1/size108148/5